MIAFDSKRGNAAFVHPRDTHNPLPEKIAISGTLLSLSAPHPATPGTLSSILE